MGADLRTLVESAPDVVAVFDRERRIVFVNNAIETATGIAARELTGKHVADVMLPDAAALWGEALDDVIQHGGTREIDCSLDSPRGKRQLAARLWALGDGTACAIMRDVTDALGSAQRAAEEEARRARSRERQLHVIAARLSSALTQDEIARSLCEEVAGAFSARTATVAVERDGFVHVLHAHGVAREVLGSFRSFRLASALPMADAIRTGTVVWCPTIAALGARYPELAALLAARRVHALGVVPFTFQSRTAGAISVGLGESRELSNDDRELLQALGQVAAQALERARLYEAHQRSEQQLRTALDAAGAATWTLDVESGQGMRDASYLKLLGLTERTAVSDFSSIHPEDRDMARAAYQRTIRDGATYDPTVRVARGDGSYVWVQAFARLMHDPVTKRRLLSGVIVDIDEAKRASIRAEEERRLNETLLRLASSFASELDHDRLISRILDETSALVGAESGSFSPACTQPNVPTTPSILEVPIVSRSGELFGQLTFRHSDPDRFSDQHARIAAMLASHAAIALENARLYRSVRKHKEALEVAVERAQRADRRKDELLAMLGHELRNPLAPIVTALDLMDHKAADATRKEREVIRRQVTHLTRLVDDLLDVARITRGKIQLAKEVIEVSTVLQKAIEMASPLLERRLQRLVVHVARDGLLVDADPTRLAQVLQNLLTNASKYSDLRSTIEVDTSITDDQLTLHVRDEGIGIAPELLPHLFDMFAQGDRALDRSEGGLGIGLTIARSLCELHGGSIAVESSGHGKGSTFSVTLPRSTRPRQTTEAIAPLRIGRSAGISARVLVVDDNVDAAMMLREMLTELGHHLEVAHDGPSALELAASFKPDIAVLDIGLPVMSGYELAGKLRERLGDDKLRLIALTGYGQDADRTRAHAVGFDHHLVKPIELDALLALLTK